LEVISSDELRRAQEFVERTGIELRHALSTSPFSAGARIFAASNGIDLPA
jgi:hypothetical protein